MEPILDVGRQHADHGAGNLLFTNIPRWWAETKATLQLKEYWKEIVLRGSMSEVYLFEWRNWLENIWIDFSIFVHLDHIHIACINSKAHFSHIKTPKRVDSYTCVWTTWRIHLAPGIWYGIELSLQECFADTDNYHRFFGRIMGLGELFPQSYSNVLGFDCPATLNRLLHDRTDDNWYQN